MLGCSNAPPSAEPAPAVSPASVPSAPASPSASPSASAIDAEAVFVAAPSDCPPQTLGVPGGRFIMGSDGSEAGRDERPVHTVVVAPFCMDRTEMAGADGRTPRVFTAWADASAACKERGGRLPTEAEFEKAARGGCELGQDPERCDSGDRRPYPWGKQAPNCELANHSAVGPGGPKRCLEGPASVDSYAKGAGPYGHINLAGNLWEATLDWHHPGVYRAGRTDNPAGPVEGRAHSLRGGAWNTFGTNMRISNRFSDHIHGSQIGARCVFAGGSPQVEDVPPLAWVDMAVEVRQKSGAALDGRWLTVTAFDVADLMPNGMPVLGRSPVSEAGAQPSGEPTQRVTIAVPDGVEVKISAALDIGGSTGGPGPAASSGGIGWAAAAVRAAEGVQVPVVVAPLPAHPHTPRP